MSQQIIVINKPLGQTPFEAVTLFKEENPEYKDITISYAGRLDPMAHGLLLLLIGEENKKRENYLHLHKTYEVQILFGFETDTYDILGILSKVSEVSKVSQTEIEKELKAFVGKREQTYPSYSSKAVNGKPLFWWARNKRLHEIDIPKREVEIESITFLSKREMQGSELLHTIGERIRIVKGDFRQTEIMQRWENSINTNVSYTIIKIVVDCSSGTYMRSLAHELGKKLGYGGVAYDIFRTKVGKYSL